MKTTKKFLGALIGLVVTLVLTGCEAGSISIEETVQCADAQGVVRIRCAIEFDMELSASDAGKEVSARSNFGAAAGTVCHELGSPAVAADPQAFGDLVAKKTEDNLSRKAGVTSEFDADCELE
ncbi:MAG: hypothetical protein HUU30_04280 [Burkholderiaceae bacterium]|nr:hypothetical protein [Burkholderiaceae bacterium]